jgi:hypothetical protein
MNSGLPTPGAILAWIDQDTLKRIRWGFQLVKPALRFMESERIARQMRDSLITCITLKEKSNGAI